MSKQPGALQGETAAPGAVCPTLKTTGTHQQEFLLRGTIVNTRTYGIHKNYISSHFYYQYLVLLTMAPRNSESLVAGLTCHAQYCCTWYILAYSIPGTHTYQIPGSVQSTRLVFATCPSFYTLIDSYCSP